MSWGWLDTDDMLDSGFSPPGHVPFATVESQLFREAMSRLGAAVHVVTTAGAAGTSGFTATAVCSVADRPATLLVCLNRRSQSTPVVQANGVFCVNTLRAGEQSIADAFAGRIGSRADRFAKGEWITLKTGAPVLSSAVVAFDCRVVEIKGVASHNVIFGAVMDVHLGAPGPALVYHDRAYKQV
jgi:flavin reductase (DIM6/NTAB) family NADH-FMN oxidoreductase RutF